MIQLGLKVHQMTHTWQDTLVATVSTPQSTLHNKLIVIKVVPYLGDIFAWKGSFYAGKLGFLLVYSWAVADWLL